MLLIWYTVRVILSRPLSQFGHLQESSGGIVLWRRWCNYGYRSSILSPRIPLSDIWLPGCDTPAAVQRDSDGKITRRTIT